MLKKLTLGFAALLFVLGSYNVQPAHAVTYNPVNPSTTVFYHAANGVTLGNWFDVVWGTCWQQIKIGNWQNPDGTVRGFAQMRYIAGTCQTTSGVDVSLLIGGSISQWQFPAYTVAPGVCTPWNTAQTFTCNQLGDGSLFIAPTGGGNMPVIQGKARVCKPNGSSDNCRSAYVDPF